MANVQVVLKFSQYGQDVLNVTNWQFAQYSDAYIQSFVDSLRSSLVANWQTEATSSITFTGVQTRLFDGLGPYTVDKDPTLGPLQGADAVQALPTQVALLVSTLYSGPRPNRGRIYFGGLGENHQVDSQWEATVLASYEALVTQWANGLTVTGGNAFLRIARVDFANNVWLADSPVETIIARPRPATIRNRRLAA